MKKAILLVLLVAVAACKPDSKKEETKRTSQVETMVPKPAYPDALEKVFAAHGGLDLWKQQRTLSYNMAKGDMMETHTVDLWSRKDRIDAEKFTMGFDGKDVWLMDADENYKGDPVFYHNLMFYFYAMPFVLADDGIVFGETEDLVFEGKNYQGVRITYNSGVGTSPKDEYYIHIDSETGQMAWLGYTVTYRTGEVSTNVKWIRYNDWQNIDGLLLPKSITWHNYEGRKILDARKPVPFENVGLDKVSKSSDFYAKPEQAITVEPKQPSKS